MMKKKILSNSKRGPASSNVEKWKERLVILVEEGLSHAQNAIYFHGTSRKWQCECFYL